MKQPHALVSSIPLLATLLLAACADAPVRSASPSPPRGDPAATGVRGESAQPRSRGETDRAASPRGVAASGAAAQAAVAQPPAPARSFTTDRPAPQKVALLVGIDDYAPGTPDAFRNLSGCVRDTQRVKQILVERFDFPAEEILVLNNAEATHANIVRAFHDWLIARATPETEVMFWFSGHGSRVPDVSGASGTARASTGEQDKKDSSFLAYDSRMGNENGAYDLSDDEIRSLLFALTRKTGRVTVVTDSCHSGGGTRGVKRIGEPRYRGADEGARPVDLARLKNSFWPPDVKLLDDGDRESTEPERYVHIAACANSQLAQEIDLPGEDGQPVASGALTFFLTQCLETAQPHVSYRDLADQTSVKLTTQIPNQTVWYEGGLDRELFGAHFKPRPIGFLAHAIAGDEVRVEAGSACGLQADSILAVCDPTSGASIGRARVKSANAISSTAVWLDPKPEAPVRGALRAIEETRPARQAPLRLWIPDPALAARFEKSERVHVERTDPRSAEYRLEVEASDGRLALFAPGNLRIWKETEEDQPIRASPEFVSRLEENTFRRELRYRALFALSTEPGSLKLQARFRSPTDEELEDLGTRNGYESAVDAQPRIASAEGVTATGGRAGAAGAEYSAYGSIDSKKHLRLAMLDIQNTTDSRQYISVVSLTEDRGRNVIWPQGEQRDRVLEKGAELPVPVSVVVNPIWKDERPMRDRYLVIATSEPADFKPIEENPTLRGGPVVAADSKMPDLLKAAVEGPQTRGVKTIKPDYKGWGITTVDLLVERPKKP